MSGNVNDDFNVKMKKRMITISQKLTFWTMLLRSVARMILTLAKAWVTSGSWQIKREDEQNTARLKRLFKLIFQFESLVHWYLGEVGIGSQLGQCRAYGVTCVWHSAIGAGRVWQGVGQRGSLICQTGFKFHRSLLQNLQGGADVLQGFLGLSHGYKKEAWNRRL